MTELDNRKKAFEKKIEVEGELDFKIMAHAAKHLGQWAAKELALPETEVEAYVSAITRTGLGANGREEMIHHIEKDFQKKGLPLTRYHIAHKLDEQTKHARGEIRGG